MDESTRFGGGKELSTMIEPIPEEIAGDFVRNRENFGRNSLLVHEGDKTKIWRVFRRAEEIPSIGRCALVLDYRKYHEGQTKKFDRLQFEYLQEDPIEQDKERVIAQMHVQCISDGVFVLDHRHVIPEFRGGFGLGSRLYQQVESFVQQIANMKNSDQAIQLSTGQKSVTDWAEKMGFKVALECQEFLEEKREFPERFVEDDVFVSPESQAQGIVKDRYTFRKEALGRYMEDAIRITMKKVIHPHETREQENIPEVRLATIADAADIARIQNDSWLVTYPNEDAGITREDLMGYLGKVDARAFRWEGRLEKNDPNVRISVLKHGDRVIGFSSVTRMPNVGHVDALYLDPEFSEKRMGGEALEEGLRWLGNDKPIELEVASYNSRAIRFYERFGFRKQGAAKPVDLRNGKEIPLMLMVRDAIEK